MMLTDLPNSFQNDPQAVSANPAAAGGIGGYSWWEYGKNDPYFTGWGVTNRGTVNGGLPGDAIIAPSSVTESVVFPAFISARSQDAYRWTDGLGLILSPNVFPVALLTKCSRPRAGHVTAS